MAGAEVPLTAPTVILPSRTRQAAADASRDFLCYMAFVRGHVPSWHHLVIVERLLYGSRYELILGPPAVAKTQVVIEFVEWMLGRLPNFKVLCMSEVAGAQASAFTREVGSTLADNEAYHMVFGDLRGPSPEVWSSTGLKLRPYISPELARLRRVPPSPAPPFPWLGPRGREPGKDLNLKAVGWRSSYTGVRADLLVGDDVVSDRSSWSEKITQDIFDTLHQKALSRLEGSWYQRAFLMGQRWAPRDLFGRLIERGVVVYDNNPDLEGVHVLEFTEEAA